MSAQPPRTPAAPLGVAVFVAALGGTLYFLAPDLMDDLGRYEDRKYVVYADKLARGLPTVCKGITRHVTTTPIIIGERWSREKCDLHERAVAHTIQRELVACFRVLPPQSVFNAATSLSWNVGVRGVCNSQSMRLWNQRQWAAGCTRIASTPGGQPNWSNAAGVFVPGLHNRRKAEMRTCLSGLGK